MFFITSWVNTFDKMSVCRSLQLLLWSKEKSDETIVTMNCFDTIQTPNKRKRYFNNAMSESWSLQSSAIFDKNSCSLYDCFFSFYVTLQWIQCLFDEYMIHVHKQDNDHEMSGQIMRSFEQSSDWHRSVDSSQNEASPSSTTSWETVRSSFFSFSTL